MWQKLLAVLKAGSWAPAVNTLIMIGATVGIETTAQANAATAVVGGVLSLGSLLVTAVHAFKGVKAAARVAAK